MVTRRHLEAYHEEHLTLLTARIDQAVAPINEEIQGLRSRLAVLEGGSARNRGFSERPRSTDPAFKRIVFKKIPENMSAHQRILAMEEFMRTHFPNIRIRDVANFFFCFVYKPRTHNTVSKPVQGGLPTRKKHKAQSASVRQRPVAIKTTY